MDGKDPIRDGDVARIIIVAVVITADNAHC
jgi:hypothetical protein